MTKITIDSAVVEQAIAALTDLTGWRAAPLCDLLRAALEPQNDQEPVAWCELDANRREIAYFDGKPTIMTGPTGNEHHPEPLYTQPQSKRKLLTDEQIDQMFSNANISMVYFAERERKRHLEIYSFGVRDAEAAHNII